jgi:hypothetical protein
MVFTDENDRFIEEAKEKHLVKSCYIIIASYIRALRS